MKLFTKKNSDYDSMPMKVYGDLVFKHFSRGLADVQEPLDYLSNQICYNKIMTKRYICYYFQVKSFGDTTSYNLLGTLRDVLRIKYSRPVYVDLMCESTPHQIKWNSMAMKNNIHIWRNSKKTKKEKSEAAEEQGFSSAMHDMEQMRQKRLENSWEYFKKCEEERTGIALTSVVFRIRIPIQDVNFSQILLETVSEVFQRQEMVVNPINMYLYDLIQLISPFKHEHTKLARMLLANRVLSTTITSSFEPTTQGHLNDGNLILGNDIKNHQLVKIDTHPKDQSGTNVLVVGMTGSGKSCMMKSVLEQVLAIGDYLYITDYEGNEYTPFGDAYGAVYLDLQGDDGKYYEPLRLTTLTDIPELNKGILQSAINGVYQLISVLMGKPLTASQEKLVSQAITEHAKSVGVDLDDKATWINSDKMSIKGLLPKLKVYSNSRQMLDKYGSQLTELVDTLSTYFEGVYKYMFTKPISFDELKDARIIITRFGSDSTSAVTGAEEVDLRIKQLTTMLLNSEIARYRRAKNQSFIMLYEELQRYLNHQGSSEWLNTIWTGIRKCNGTCIGIINDPGKLNQDISALINNSTYFIIGKTEDLKSLDYVFENPKLRGCRGLVEGLLKLNRCFLLKNNTTTTIFRCELPMVLVKSPIYSTRSDDK